MMVITQVDVRFPSGLVAVIVTSPGAKALTSPYKLTVATDGLLLPHVTFFDAPSGVTINDSC